MGLFDAEEDDPTFMAVFKLACGIAMTVAVPFVAYFTIKIFVTASRSNSWPSAQGRITRFDIETFDRKGLPYYRPNVQYSFSVDGKDYNGSRLSFRGYDSPSRADIEEMGVKYAAGTQHPVYYDGADPTQSVIERGTNWLVYIGLLIPAVLVIVGPIMIKEQSQMLRQRAGRKKPAKSKSRNKPPRRRPAALSDE